MPQKMQNHFLEQKYALCIAVRACTGTRSSRGPRTKSLFLFFFVATNPRSTRGTRFYTEHNVFFFFQPPQKMCSGYAEQHTFSLAVAGTPCSFTRPPRIHFACDVGGCPNILFCPSVRYILYGRKYFFCDRNDLQIYFSPYKMYCSMVGATSIN